MELGIKDWMIIVGVLLLVAVLFDGVRRVINDRRNNIRMRAKPVYHDDDIDTINNHEIQGSVRVILRPDGSPMPLSEQKVPVLLEPADDLKGNKKSRRKKKEKNEHLEPTFKEDVPFTIDAFDEQYQQRLMDEQTEFSAESTINQDLTANETHDHQQMSQSADRVNAKIVEETPLSESNRTEIQDEVTVDRVEAKETDKSSEQDVVVIYVLAKDKAGFKGTDLMQVLLGCNMRYGRMNIFHRYEDGSTEDVQFSVANLVEPGTFDLDTMNHTTTPGVTFFMTLPGPEKPLQAFDYLAGTAFEVAKHLGGEILDERKRVLNEALILERRQRVKQFTSQTATV